MTRSPILDDASKLGLAAARVMIAVLFLAGCVVIGSSIVVCSARSRQAPPACSCGSATRAEHP